MSKALKSVNIQGLTSVNEILVTLEDQFNDLIEITRSTDFSAPADVDQYYRNIVFIKNYYDRAEQIIREKMDLEAANGVR